MQLSQRQGALIFTYVVCVCSTAVCTIILPGLLMGVKPPNQMLYSYTLEIHTLKRGASRIIGSPFLLAVVVVVGLLECELSSTPSMYFSDMCQIAILGYAIWILLPPILYFWCIRLWETTERQD